MKFIKVVNFSLLIFTLVYLFVVQVVDPFDLAKVWRTRNIPHKKLLSAKRGDFYDRSGKLLVSSDNFYQIDIDKNLLDIHSRKTGDDLSDIYVAVADVLDYNIGVDAYSILTKSKTLGSVYIKNMVPAVLIKNIREGFSRGKLPSPLISYNGSKRTTMIDLDLSPIIGQTKSVSKEVVDSREFRENLLGVSGLEKFFEQSLHGTDGWQKFYANGTPFVQDCYQKKPEDGADIFLTIDSEIQEILSATLKENIKKFKAKSAMGLVMNPKTGEILAACGYTYKKGKVTLPYSNYIISYLFAPGSTIKPFILQLALDKNLFTQDTRLDCSPYQVKGESRLIKDHWTSRKSDTLTFEQILQYSSNVGVMKVAEKVGGNALYDRLKKLGFGSYLLTDMYGEEQGILRDPSQWSDYTLTSLSIGHEIALTPIQLASAYASIANGGYLLRPYVVKRIEYADGRVQTKGKKILAKVSNSKNINLLKKMMSKVVEGGTAVKTKIRNMHIAGKTGTAEELARSSKNKLVHSSSFCGFFPIDNPKYLILIVFEDAKGLYHYASKSAVPTFRQVVTKMIIDPKINVIGKEPYLVMPDIRGLSKAKAEFILNEVGIKCKFVQNSDKDSIVVDQFPKSYLKFAKGIPATVVLGAELRKAKKTDLNFIGLTLREAFALAQEKGISIEVTGSGVVKSQHNFGFVVDLRAE